MHDLQLSLWQAAVMLALGLYLLAKSSTWLVDSAVGIADRFKVPKLLIGIVLVGLATTAPEFAVSVLSALQGKAEMALGNAVGSVIVDDGVALAVGDIIGADILNIAWIAGASAVVNPLTLSAREIYFMFPAMLLIVFTMLGWLLIKKKMSRALGVILMSEYVVYFVLMVVLFPPRFASS
jgi:cation:H+ antiporter